MLRGEVAKKLGIDIETIRFYEKENLISKPNRLENGYRFYSKQNLVELKFIQHCRSLGVSIDEVRTLKELPLLSEDCSQAKAIVEKNLDLIEKKIKDLKSLRNQLRALSESCFTTGSAKDCAIVKSLTKAAKGEDCVCHSDLMS